MKIVFYFFLLTSLTSCLYKPIEIKNIETLSYNAFRTDSFVLNIEARIDNPNFYAIKLAESNIYFTLSGDTFFVGQLINEINLPKDTIINIPISFNLEFGDGGVENITSILATSFLTGKTHRTFEVLGLGKFKVFGLSSKEKFKFEQTIDLKDFINNILK